MSRNLGAFRFDYDEKFDVLYLYKNGNSPAGGISLGNVSLDLDKNKEIVGVEILQATDLFALLMSKPKSTIRKALKSISRCRLKLLTFSNITSLHFIIETGESPIDTKLNLISADADVPTAVAGA